MDSERTKAPAEQIKDLGQRVGDNVDRVMVGKRGVVELLLAAILAEGHVLLEDVPGVGKTTLAKAVARSLDRPFKRIQFTPDLLPSDVTGLNYFNQGKAAFEFLPGPIMAGVVLADEINRATPRTQSCLLEAMEERQVTVDTETIPLERPFLVMATQNPVEQEGTFPLPEAQLDRFMLRLAPGYPTADEEAQILDRFKTGDPLTELEPVVSGPELLELIGLTREILVRDSVRDYIVSLARATRDHGATILGASPRATRNLYQAAQAKAALNGRAFVLPDDVKAVAEPVLAHRLILGSEARIKGGTARGLVGEILERVDVPVE